MDRVRWATILIAIIVFSAAAPGTQPEAASEGLAGSEILGETVLPQPKTLQASLLGSIAASAAHGSATIYAETDEQIETAISALNRMAEAGLELPAVSIHLHDGRIKCSNDPDRLLTGYYAQVDGHNIIHSCGTEWTLIHELTHLWDKHHLTDDLRQKILDHQGLDRWHDNEWSRSGAEHLASIVANVLLGMNSSRVGYYDRDHQAVAYELATTYEVPKVRPSHTFTTTTDEQSELIAWALDLFVVADMDLPGIDFIGFDDAAECWDRSGAAIRHNHRTEIRLCFEEGKPTNDWVVLHEIAHAWDHLNLGEATHDVFLELRGLGRWREGVWYERGAEQAAEIITWGLIDRSTSPGRIENNSCPELLAGYRLLTGSEPSSGYTQCV
jgi:hypothetical protein